MWLRLFVLVLGISPSLSEAAENAVVTSRFQLLGVISTTSPREPGIAVIRDRVQNRTLTLKSGEFLPGDVPLRITTIERKQVLLSDGAAQVALSYEGRAESSENNTHVEELVETLPLLDDPIAREHGEALDADIEVARLRRLLVRTQGDAFTDVEDVTEEVRGEDFGH